MNATAVRTALDAYSPSVLQRARDLLTLKRPLWERESATLLWARGTYGVRYRVEVIEAGDEAYVTCTCPNGKIVGVDGRPRCYHSALALLLVLADAGETR